MVSIEKWKEHFRCMAQKGHTHEETYSKHTLHKVRKTIGNTPITIVSPVAGNLDRTKALMEGGGGKRKKIDYKKRRQWLKLSLRKKLPRRRQLLKLEKKGENKKEKKKKKTTYIPKCIKK